MPISPDRLAGVSLHVSLLMRIRLVVESRTPITRRFQPDTAPLAQSVRWTQIGLDHAMMGWPRICPLSRRRM